MYTHTEMYTHIHTEMYARTHTHTVHKGTARPRTEHALVECSGNRMRGEVEKES